MHIPNTMHVNVLCLYYVPRKGFSQKSMEEFMRV